MGVLTQLETVFMKNRDTDLVDVNFPLLMTEFFY